MKKNIIVSLFNCLIVLIISMVLCRPALAVEDASPTPSSDDEVKAKIKERLEQVAQQDFTEVKNEVEKEAGKVYAWVGTTESISQPTLSIQTNDGEKQAKIASTAAILKVLQGQGKKAVTEKEISKGQYIIIMGPKDENGAIIGKRIVIQDQAPTAPVKREYIFGKVTEVDDEKMVVKKNGDTINILIGKKTGFKIIGQKTATLSKVQVGDYAGAIITLDKNDQVDLVKSVLVIPGATNPEADQNKVNEETATASASPKASSKPSPTPKSSPKQE